MADVILFSADLITAAKVAGAAPAAGVKVNVLGTEAAVLTAAAGSPLVILDLEAPGADPEGLVPRLRALTPPPRAIVAFGPHVQTARLEAARAAGCHQVLARGQFYAQVADLLRRHTAPVG